MKTLTILLITIVVSFAQPMNGHRGQGYGKGHGQGYGKGYRLRYELNLTETQFNQLQDERNKVAKELEPLRDKIRTIRMEMIRNYDNDKEVKQLADDLAKTHKEMSIIMVNQLKSISKILNKEQMEKFINFRLERKQTNK